MSFWVIIGIVLVLGLIAGVGLLSGRRVRDSKDFLSGGGQAGPLLVCGSILGSLVSSQATIGTAQLAFHYGLAAWWFTLGSGLCSIGIFISVLSQVVACSGLLAVLFPGLSLPAAAGISIALMCVYVIFGGAWGAGMGGVLKLALLCALSVLGLVFVLLFCGGAGGLLDTLTANFTATGLGGVQSAANGLKNLGSRSDVLDRYGNLIARGAAKDIGSGLSLLLGVLSTQTYAQAVWSARTDRAARRGALLSACLIPLIGVGSICAGLYMRAHYLLAAEAAALAGGAPDMPVLESTLQVFPAFVLNHLPPLAAGVGLGTLLIAVVGGGASREAVASWVSGLGLPSGNAAAEGENPTLNITVNGTTLTAALTDNSSAQAFRDLLADGPKTIAMSDYNNMEKVGPLGRSLPTNDERITTQAASTASRRRSCGRSWARETSASRCPWADKGADSGR